MGASESVPRNIVIDKERGIFDESFEPSLLKKTKFTQQKEKLPRIEYTGNELISEQEFKDLKDIYDEKIRILQQRNAELYGATIENFARAVERAEEKYLNALQPPVCGESQNKLLVCLKANKDKILDCGHLFDDFNFCMQKHRSTKPNPKSR